MSLSATRLDWDSDLLGIEAWRLDGFASVPAAALRRELDTLLAGHRGQLFLAKIPEHARDAADCLLERGGRLLGVEGVYRLAAEPEAVALPGVAVRFLERVDPAPFLELAQDMRHSRFFLDAAVSPQAAVALWQESLANHCQGLAAELAVVMRHGEPAGLAALTRDGEGLRLGIVGIRRAYRGQRLGQALITAAARKHGRTAPLCVEAFTSNIPAVQLYERCGFRLESSVLVLHAWRTPAG